MVAVRIFLIPAIVKWPYLAVMGMLSNVYSPHFPSVYLVFLHMCKAYQHSLMIVHAAGACQMLKDHGLVSSAEA